MTRLLCLLLVLLALPVRADMGIHISDGDTLKFQGVTWRIHGIDSPELHQQCPDGWNAGKASADGLRGLLEGKTLTCEPIDRDRYGRIVGRCKASGMDIGAEMVRRGLAWSFTRYSVEYAPLEDQARALRVGIHQHNCEPAWLWRAEKRR